MTTPTEAIVAKLREVADRIEHADRIEALPPLYVAIGVHTFDDNPTAYVRTQVVAPYRSLGQTDSDEQYAERLLVVNRLTGLDAYTAEPEKVEATS